MLKTGIPAVLDDRGDRVELAVTDARHHRVDILDFDHAFDGATRGFRSRRVGLQDLQIDTVLRRHLADALFGKQRTLSSG